MNGTSPMKVRTVLESGSQVNLITMAATRELNVQVPPRNESISGLGNSAANILGRCQLLIKSVVNNFNV